MLPFWSFKQQPRDSLSMSQQYGLVKLCHGFESAEFGCVVAKLDLQSGTAIVLRARTVLSETLD